MLLHGNNNNQEEEIRPMSPSSPDMVVICRKEYPIGGGRDYQVCSEQTQQSYNEERALAKANQDPNEGLYIVIAAIVGCFIGWLIITKVK
jgi:hypothetical protein